MNGLGVMAIAADVLTIVAAGIALWGIYAVFRSRPRVSIDVSDFGRYAVSIRIRNDEGTEPLRDVLVAKGLLDEDGFLTTWDGSGQWVPSIGPKQMLIVLIFDPEETQMQGEPRSHELYHPIDVPAGALMEITWRHPLVPWKRVHRAIRWTLSERAAGTLPKTLKGRAAKNARNKAERTV